ncbi:MAG: Protease synthase and sporulation negative regulatory protein PAI 1 [Burkholderia sp.]|jgi:GNAT superfamily N-acetyltransferase
MEFFIRDARPEDCGAVCELVRELADYEKLSDECHATEEKLRAELFGPKPVIGCLIGWERDEGGERPVAMALYFYNFSTFEMHRGIYLEDLFVKDGHRSRGYGSRLIRALAAKAVKEGCPRFDWQVLDWNKPAIDFYKSLGAKVRGEWLTCRLEGESLRRAASR